MSRPFEGLQQLSDGGPIAIVSSELAERRAEVADDVTIYDVHYTYEGAHGTLEVFVRDDTLEYDQPPEFEGEQDLEDDFFIALAAELLA